MCGYSDKSAGPYEWQRMQPAVNGKNLGPSTDNSNNTKGNFY